MAENYKHLYEQMKKLVEQYQDEIVPGMRKQIEDLERNREEVVRCEDCKKCSHDTMFGARWCHGHEMKPDDFCSYGERSEGE